NSVVYTNPVINHTQGGKRRYVVSFDTSLKADLAVVERETMRAVADNPEIAQQPGPIVNVVGIDSANDVLSWRIFFWADPTKAVEVRTISAALEQIKRTLFDEGVPTPTATSATLFKKDGGNGRPSSGATP